jgi:hypothetical protein
MHPLVMHGGYQPPPRVGVVLLSGPDSVAAAHWAAGRYAPIVAVGVDYMSDASGARSGTAPPSMTGSTRSTAP